MKTGCNYGSKPNDQPSIYGSNPVVDCSNSFEYKLKANSITNIQYDKVGSDSTIESNYDAMINHKNKDACPVSKVEIKDEAC